MLLSSALAERKLSKRGLSLDIKYGLLSHICDVLDDISLFILLPLLVAVAGTWWAGGSGARSGS